MINLSHVTQLTYLLCACPSLSLSDGAGLESATVDRALTHTATSSNSHSVTTYFLSRRSILRHRTLSFPPSRLVDFNFISKTDLRVSQKFLSREHTGLFVCILTVGDSAREPGLATPGQTGDKSLDLIYFYTQDMVWHEAVFIAFDFGLLCTQFFWDITVIFVFYSGNVSFLSGIITYITTCSERKQARIF